jgi:anti-sigma factor ChrR (cupin superfamily)
MKEVIPNSAAVRLALSGSRFVDVAALQWSELVAGLRMKVLYKDDQAKEAMMLVEAAPGSIIPEHVHGGVEWVLVLEGAMEDEEGVVSAGNFVSGPPAADIRCVCLR